MFSAYPSKCQSTWRDTLKTSVITVRDLKEKLAQFPDNYLITLEDVPDPSNTIMAVMAMYTGGMAYGKSIRADYMKTHTDLGNLFIVARPQRR